MDSNKNLVKGMKKRGTIKSKKAENAFLKTDRRNFVPKEYEDRAYGDSPLPIQSSQTINQPSTVAMMTELLEVKKGHKVLEVGSGSGYQAAILSKLVGSKGKVFTIEYDRDLSYEARHNLEDTGVGNVTVIRGDGSKGYEEQSPYDRIIVTAAAPDIPSPLLSQLRPKGILIIPIGTGKTQEMQKITKNKKGFKRESFGLYRFVPLKGESGQDE